MAMGAIFASGSMRGVRCMTGVNSNWPLAAHIKV